MTTTVFRNGALFDGHRYAGAGAVVVEDDRVARVRPARPTPATADRAGRATGSSTCRRPAGARLRRRPRAPVQGGLERMRCDLSEGDDPRGLPRHDRGVRRGPPRRAVDPRRRLGDGGLPRRHADRRRPRRVVPDRPVFLPNRDHHGAWVNTPRAGDRRRSTRDTPDPPHGRFERDADGRPTGTLHEGAMALVASCCRARPARGLLRRAAGRAALPALARRHRLAGRDRRRLRRHGRPGADLPATRPPAGDLTAHVVGALWWDRDAGRRAGRRPRRAAGGDTPHGRFRATSVKIMQDGVAENGTAAMSAPYLDRCGHADDNTRPLVRRRRARCGRASPRSTPRGSRCTCTRSATAACARRSTRSSTPGDADRRRRPRHHIAHLQLVHPDDVPAVRRARRGREHAGALGVPRRPDGRPDAAVPRRGAGRAGSTRSATCTAPAPGWSRAATGRSARPTRWPRSTSRSTARRTARRAGRAASRSCPSRRSTLETAFAAYTSGSAWVNHRDDAGVLRAGAVADLVVLDRDPFAGPPEEIGAARVVSTWVDGAPVFEA